MRAIAALLLCTTLPGCVFVFDLDPEKQAKRESLLAPELPRVPTGFKETWAPSPVTFEDAPSGLLDPALPLHDRLPGRLRARPEELKPREDGAEGAIPGLDPKPEDRTSPAALGAIEKALEELRGRSLPKIELPPVGPPPLPKDKAGP